MQYFLTAVIHFISACHFKIVKQFSIAMQQIFIMGLISQVGFRITLFEACSAFTHVTACMIAESPVRDPFHRRLQRLHRFHRCSDCYRPERQLPGGTFTH